MNTIRFGGACAVLFACSAFAAAPPVLAETDPTPATTVQEPIVVTATRTQVPASEVLAAVSVISREEIERSQALDLPELLRFQSGIDLGRNGAPGQFSSAFIRGGESNHSLVLIDGVRVNPATSGGAALQNIAPDMIERIEIVRGPRATLYGSDAIGGVINIITRGPPRGPQADFVVRGGPDDLYDVATTLGYGGEAGAVSLSAEHLDTDGMPTCVGSTLDRGYQRASVNLRGDTRVRGVELSARFWNAEGEAEYLDFCDPELGFAPRDQDYRNQTLALELGGSPLPQWHTRFGYTRGLDDIQQNQAGFSGTRDFVKTTRPALDWHNEWALSERQRLSFGAQAQREEVDARSGGEPIREDRDIVNVFMQDEIHLGRHRMLAAVGYADHDAFGSKVNWNAEYGFDLFAATRLIASAASGFRAPDATDRFGFGGNTELDPERARNYELGLRHELSAAQTVDLRLFRSDVEDLIEVAFDAENDPDVDFGFRAVNIDRFRNDGAELSWRYRTTRWDGRLTAIHQDPRDESDDSTLLRRARRSVTASLVHRWARADLGFDVLGSGSRPDVDPRTGERIRGGGYALFNLTGGVSLHPRWRLETRIENVLDKDYATAAGYRQPDLGAYVNLRYRL